MNISELISPIRIYWDIDGPHGVPEEDCRRIAREIISSKFLSLQLTENAPAFTTSCLAILETFKNEPIALSLVAPISALDQTGLQILQASSIKVVFATANSLADLEIIAAISKQSQGKPVIGVSFPITRDNVLDLPDVLSFCVEHKVPHLLLPMQRLMTEVECFSFSKTERKKLTGQLDKIEKPSWLKITIHDPFLWRAFYPAVEFPNGGCQAANTMLYISPEADVYPCPTMPIKIGNLLARPLKEMITSSGKKELRRKILEKPSNCVVCGEGDECKGGCRGRAYAMERSLAKSDPACR